MSSTQHTPSKALFGAALRIDVKIAKIRSTLDVLTHDGFIAPGACPHDAEWEAGELTLRVRVLDSDHSETVHVKCTFEEADILAGNWELVLEAAEDDEHGARYGHWTAQ